MLYTRILPFNPLETNCIVLWADDAATCALVDPGISSDEEETVLLSFLQEHGLTPEAILLTHGHFDHVWGVERLLARFPVPVYLHPDDKGIVADGGYGPKLAQSISMLRHDFPSQDIADGDVLHFADTDWKVLHTPGHTPGGVSYYSEENSLLLSGDTLFAGCIGRTDFPGGDYDVLMQSIRTRLLTLPGDTDVIPGHGQPTGIAREGMYNPFLLPFNEPDPDWDAQDGIPVRGL